jgi:hypothetical protein
MDDKRITRNLSIRLADARTVRYRELLTLQNKELTPPQISRAMTVKFLEFSKPDGTWSHITEDQYDALPLFVARDISAWMDKVLLQEAEKDVNDSFLATLPSGQKVRYRMLYARDQFEAEKWAAKQPAYFTPYLIETSFTFENAEGEFTSRIVEEIVEMSLSDGYAMNQLIQRQEGNDDFFLNIWADLSENMPQDSSITASRSAKFKK